MASTYFLSIQDEFVRLRGTPFLLAATDFEISDAWRRAGVPLAVVLDTMRTVLEGRKPGRRSVRGLKIIDRAVWTAWRQLGGMRVDDSAPGQTTCDQYAERLRELAAVVRGSTLTAADEIAAEVETVRGSVAEREDRLSALDQHLLESAVRELGDNWIANQQRRAEHALAGLKARLSAQQWGSECRAWVDEVAREVLQLPRLSLFG